MRRWVIGALDQFKRAQRLSLKLRGLTPEGVAEQRIVTGQAWDEFCDTLKAAGASLKFPGTPQDPFSQAARGRSARHRCRSRVSSGGQGRPIAIATAAFAR